MECRCANTPLMLSVILFSDLYNFESVHLSSFDQFTITKPEYVMFRSALLGGLQSIFRNTASNRQEVPSGSLYPYQLSRAPRSCVLNRMLRSSVTSHSTLLMVFLISNPDRSLHRWYHLMTDGTRQMPGLWGCERVIQRRSFGSSAL